METLLFGSASALRLMLTVVRAASSAAAQTIKSFFVEWYFPQVRLKLLWKSWCRLNLRREDVPRWGRADEDDDGGGGEVSEDILEVAEEEVLRDRIIHKREEKGKRKRNNRLTKGEKVDFFFWCSVCVRVKDGEGERSARKKQKASALTSMPSAVGLCGGRTSKLFSLDLSLLLSVSETPAHLSLTHPPPPVFQLGHQLCWSPLWAVIKLQIRLSCCRKTRPLRRYITVSMGPGEPMVNDPQTYITYISLE